MILISLRLYFLQCYLRCDNLCTSTVKAKKTHTLPLHLLIVYHSVSLLFNIMERNWRTPSLKHEWISFPVYFSYNLHEKVRESERVYWTTEHCCYRKTWHLRALQQLPFYFTIQFQCKLLLLYSLTYSRHFFHSVCLASFASLGL